MCDSLQVVSQTVETTSGDAVLASYGHVEGLELRPRFNESIYTASEAKEICDNAIIYYPCVPTIEPLPEVDRAALASLKTYNGITYVEFISEIQPTFKAEAGATQEGSYVLESLLNSRIIKLNQELIKDRIAALEATIINNI